MRSFLLFVTACSLLVACDKQDEDSTAAADPNSTLLGERLIAEHGEGVLAQPVLVVYDRGYIGGRGSLDPEFADKVAKLGVKRASSLSSGEAPMDVDDFFSQEGLEFGVSESDKSVVTDSTSSLAIRLLFGKPGIDALRACEQVQLDRVCKVGGELRARLDDIPATAGVLVDGDVEIAKGKVKSGWVVFADAPEVGDETQLELILGDGVRCNMSRWVVDPRDSCAM